MTTPRLGLQTVPSNVLQPSVPINDALQALDALVHGCAAEALRNTPPATTDADAGLTYIVGDLPTGAWAGHGFEVAICTGANAWRFIPPKVGMTFYVLNQGIPFVNHNTGWAPETRIATQTGSFSLALSDKTWIDVDSASAAEVTVLSEFFVGWPDGRQFFIRQKGEGETSIVAGSGVTLEPAGPVVLAGQGAVALLTKVAEDVWSVSGGIAGGIPPAAGSIGTEELADASVTGAKLSTTIRTITASGAAVLGDANNVVQTDVITANDFTIPPNSSVAIPVGASLEVWQKGAGQTTIVAGSGVTILTNVANTLKLAAQNSGCSLRKVAPNTWRLVGDMEAAP